MLASFPDPDVPEDPMLLAICAVAPLSLGPQGPSFSEPIQLLADGEKIRVEKPGYAAPCLHDVDGDGKKDLVVGQFAKGRMKVYKGTGDGRFAAGEWLMAEGQPAEVPGVW